MAWVWPAAGEQPTKVDGVTKYALAGENVTVDPHVAGLLRSGRLRGFDPYARQPTIGDPSKAFTDDELSYVVGRAHGDIIETAGSTNISHAMFGRWIWLADSESATSSVVKGYLDVGRWKKLSPAGATQFDVRWFGGFPDGRRVSSVNVSGTSVSGAAAGTWDSSCVGHLVLVEAPSSSIGTVTVTNGSRVVSGSAFQTNIPCYSYNATIPSNGGGLRINGTKVAILFVDSQVQLQLSQPWAGSNGSYTAYQELQHASTIVSVLANGTGFTMADAAPVAINGVECKTASNSRSAILAAVTAANNGGTVYFPPGEYGINDNCFWQNLTNVTISGDGAVINDMRLASYQHAAVGLNTDPTGMMTFFLCSRVRVSGLALDGSVPVDGFVLSSGFIDNGNGSGWRQGLVFRDCDDCSTPGVRDAGRGTRGEFLLSEGNYGPAYQDPITGEQIWNKDFVVDGAKIIRASCNACNPNTGYGRRFKVLNSTLRSVQWSALLMSCQEGLVAGNFFAGDPDFDSSSDLVVLDTNCTEVQFSGNSIQDHNTTSWATGALVAFGAYDVPNVKVTMYGNSVRNCVGGYHYAGSACVKFVNVANLHLSGLSLFNITSAAAGGRYILISGQYTRDVVIEDVYAGAGANMSVGIYIDPSVPHDAVTIRRCSFAGISTPIVTNGVRLKTSDSLQTVSASSASVAAGIETVNVTYNGACAVTLVDPQTVPGKEVLVRNASTQLNTTTVSASSGTVVGGNTVVGAETCRTFKAIGTSWQCVGSV